MITALVAASLLAFGEIPPTARDAFGDTVGGLGSAVAYDARTKCVFMMPDRGAGDGTIDYRPRYHQVRLNRDGDKLHATFEKTILFRDEFGRPFSGLLADNAAAPTHDTRRCLDPEAIAVAPDGTLYVSDEYAPALLQFRRDGHLLRTIPLPAWYRPKTRDGKTDYRSKARLHSGRVENQGGEAMGILPDGKHAVLIMQCALAQDGGRGAGTSRVLILALRTGQPIAEYAYAFADDAGPFKNLSVNDLAVVDSHTLLVLERDHLGRDGAKIPFVARTKAVWLVDLCGATNLLPLRGQPLRRESAVCFVKKKLLFNLPDLTAQLGVPAEKLAAKWEGIALLPSKSRDVFRVLMTADNDFLDPRPTFNGVTRAFDRAEDAVPTQFFEILAKHAPIF